MSTWCSKHVEAWNKLTVKQKLCAWSWLIIKINMIYDVAQHVVSWISGKQIQQVKERVNQPQLLRRNAVELSGITNRSKGSARQASERLQPRFCSRQKLWFFVSKRTIGVQYWDRIPTVRPSVFRGGNNTNELKAFMIFTNVVFIS
jgi:hypothetical protein